MLGLMLKDLMLIKSNIKMLVMLVIFFAFMTFLGNDSFLFIPCVMSFTIILSTFSFDEYYHTNAYLATMPDGRKNIVKAKYIVAILLSLALLLISFIVGITIGTIKNTLDLEYLLVTGFSTFLSTLFLYSIIFPFTYKYGIEKGRVTLFVVFFAIVGIIIAIDKFFEFTNTMVVGFSVINIDALIILIPIIILIILFLSYVCSYRIVMNKEY